MLSLATHWRPLAATAMAALVGGAVTVSVSGCSQASRAETQSPPADASVGEKVPRVQTVTVTRQDIMRSVEMPGTVEGFETAALYAKVGGYLADISVDIGDAVKKGQELAYLAIPEMKQELKQKQAMLEQARAEADQSRAAIRQAEAEVASANAALAEAQTERDERASQLRYRQVEYRRFEELVNSKSVRGELLDQARFQLEAAQAAVKSVEAHIRTAAAQVRSAEASLAKANADLESAQARINVAQANLDYTKTMVEYGTIRAPFDGFVVERHVDPGAFVQSADGNSAAKPLLTITRTDVVRVFVDIPMRDVRLLNRGDKAVLNKLIVLPGKEFVGDVTRFAPALGKQSRLMRAEVDFKNTDGALLPGYFGYMTILLEEMPDTPVVPSSALLSAGGEYYVYVCKGGVVRRQPVEVVYHDGATVGIASGLKGGEQIVKSGGGQIVDGQTVDAVLASN